jgi:Multicopper oxidase
MVPVVQRHVGKPVNDFEDQYLFAGLQNWPNPNITSNLHKWILANSTLQIDWESPSITMITAVNKPTCEKLERRFPDDYAPICLDTNIHTDNWVYFLIQSTLTGQEQRLYTFKIHTAHPIHLHGHDFVILDQKSTPWNESEFKPTLNNPTRRDVVMLPVNGYVVIAFRVDNPGPWLMHCHIAWHASSGLAAQFIEQADKVKPLMEEAGVYTDVTSLCLSWRQWYWNHNIPENATQEDSGI